MSDTISDTISNTVNNSIDSLSNRYDALKMNSIKIKSQVSQLHLSLEDMRNQYLDMVKKLKAEKKASQIQESSVSLLKEIIDKLSQEHVDNLVNLLTYGLQTIFFDKDYSVEILMGDKRNSKTAELYLVDASRDISDNVVRSSFKDSIGGGILAVAGFIMQVYYLGRLNQSNIMFCDESFSQVS